MRRTRADLTKANPALLDMCRVHRPPHLDFVDLLAEHDATAVEGAELRRGGEGKGATREPQAWMRSAYTRHVLSLQLRALRL